MALSPNSAKYAATFALAAIALLMTLPVNSGFIFLSFAPFVLISLLYNAIATARMSEGRRLNLTRIFVWLTVLLTVGAVHLYWYDASRTDADIAANAVVNFKARTGRWPGTLLEAGISNTNFGKKWKLAYQVGAGRPIMFYAATWVIFDMYFYNFDSHRWEFTPD